VLKIYYFDDVDALADWQTDHLEVSSEIIKEADPGIIAFITPRNLERILAVSKPSTPARDA